jgi:NhaP-type Na+/H+ or K+/H+ antiporter
MPLTILLGGLGALVIFRQLTLWEAGILAAILAPTDAGLASIVLGLVYLEHMAGLPVSSTIRMSVLATVFLSIFAHGFSALPCIHLYAKKIVSLGVDAPEHQEIDVHPSYS